VSDHAPEAELAETKLVGDGAGARDAAAGVAAEPRPEFHLEHRAHKKKSRSMGDVGATGGNPLALTERLNAAPSMLIVAIVFYPQLNALLRSAVPAVGSGAADAPGVLLRLAQLFWLYVGHLRYELPCLFADTLGQLLHFFPKGFFEEVEPYTRDWRERRNDRVLLRLQRIKSEGEKLRAAEIHPEVLRRLIARLERWQWSHSCLSFVDNLITSDEGRKAKRRFGYLSRSALDILRCRLAEAEAHWGVEDDAAGASRLGAVARGGRPSPAAAAGRSRARSSKVSMSKPRAVKMERPKKPRK
jgi:hypothetical protein